MTVNKKKVLMGATLLLSSATILASCETIYALPQDYTSPIVNNQDGNKTDVYNNIFSEIYDAIALGKTDKILDEFMYVIAKDRFGEYSEIANLYANGTAAEKAAFAKNHASMFVKSNDSYILSQVSSITEEQLLAARVDDFYERIYDRINEYFYNEITGGSYSDRGIFYEVRLARSYYQNLYDVAITGTFYEDYLPSESEFNKHDVSAVIDLDDYADYINRTLIPDYYRELLIEEFLYSDNYSALGRAYARNVDIIHLSSSTSYTSDGRDLAVAAYRVLTAFARTYIVNEDSTKVGTVDFELVSNAWRGFHGIGEDGKIEELSQEEFELLAAAGYDDTKEITLEDANGETYTITYSPITQYGILLDQYSLLDGLQGNWNDRFVSDDVSSAYSTFTNSNTYPKEVGLAIQTATLASEDYTIDGWYVKTSGITDLPEAISSRLFNISVSTEIDNFNADEMEQPGNYGDYDATDYVRYINNNYYLTPAVSQSYSQNPTNFVINESGSSYIVKVNEAVSTSKLNIQNEHSYFALRDHSDANSALFTEDTAFEVAHVLGTRDTYINSANEHYIEMYTVDYHDTAVFNYFETQFPDLFDDD